MLCVGLAIVMLSGCQMVLDQQVDSKSKLLDQGLSESEVTAKIGQPDSVSLATCGTNSANGPWSCKQYIYHGSTHRLTVFFAQLPDGTWHVNNWSAS
jgi:hypothetical protein